MERLARGMDWSHSDKFPRVTLCEFEIRQHSRMHNYIVQCALTINLFNEKLFIFVWFWYVFLAFITAVNALRWLFRSLYWPGHVQYLRKQLRAFDATQREAGILAKFAENYLRRDGMFIIRLIGNNMGEVVAGEVICGLWNNYSMERRSIAEKSGRKALNKASRTTSGAHRMEVVWRNECYGVMDREKKRRKEKPILNRIIPTGKQLYSIIQSLRRRRHHRHRHHHCRHHHTRHHHHRHHHSLHHYHRHRHHHHHHNRLHHHRLHHRRHHYHPHSILKIPIAHGAPAILNHHHHQYWNVTLAIHFQGRRSHRRP